MQRRRPLLMLMLSPALLPVAHAQGVGRRPDYQLLRADYGTTRRNQDVTPTVLQLLQRGQAVQVSNALFGQDPSPRQPKRLRLSVRDRRGRTRSFEVAEGAWFEPARYWSADAAPGRSGDEGGWRILRARWGVGESNVDVTERLRELARQDQRLRIGNDSFGVDPAPGQMKTLRVIARDGNGQRQRFDFPEGSWLDGAQFVGWGRGDWGYDSNGRDDSWDDAGPMRPGGAPLIERAEYGADDGRRIDVTRLLQDALQRQGQIELVVGNSAFGGDPAPGVPKRLWVRWRPNGGRTREDSWREDERVRLP